MEVLRVVLNAVKPSNAWSKLKFYSLFGVVGVSSLFFCFSVYQNYVNEPYRLTVCRDHYTLVKKLEAYSNSYSEMQTKQYIYSYIECLENAKSGKTIKPPYQ
jgi:hypothetical protein